ncbi:hypothetical protein J6590_032315 [Homalodisca vitripennis]|nr:hypothetical protein J6590_032315 [Homalodisca vitripennis]
MGQEICESGPVFLVMGERGRGPSLPRTSVFPLQLIFRHFRNLRAITAIFTGLFCWLIRSMFRGWLVEPRPRGQISWPICTYRYAPIVDVCLSLLAVSGLISNCLVLIVFYRRPALRSPSNRFVGSLVFANLLSAMVLAPLLVSRVPALSAGFSALVATSTVFSIVAIALDRYWAVLSPLHYAMTVTRRRSLAGTA